MTQVTEVRAVLEKRKHCGEKHFTCGYYTEIEKAFIEAGLKVCDEYENAPEFFRLVANQRLDLIADILKAAGRL